MANAESGDFLSVIGGRSEDYSEIGDRLLEFLRAAEVQHLGKTEEEEVDRWIERARRSYELVPVLGVASTYGEDQFGSFSRIPEEQAILIEPHELSHAAQGLVLWLDEIANANDAPNAHFCRELAARLCTIVHQIRAAINHAKEKKSIREE